MARIWERAVRKIQLPIAYSQGFSPRAKLSFGLALPTVFESSAEFMDITLEEPVEIDGLAERLTDALPEGVSVDEVVELHGKVDSLQECVESTEWSLFVQGELDPLTRWVDAVLTADELPITRERKGKTRVDDVRPAVLDVSIETAPSDQTPNETLEIRAHLATKPRALRPLELLGIHSPPSVFVLGRRTNQFIAPIGARRDPLAVGAAEAPHSLSCAS